MLPFLERLRTAVSFPVKGRRLIDPNLGSISTHKLVHEWRIDDSDDRHSLHCQADGAGDSREAVHLNHQRIISLYHGMNTHKVCGAVNRAALSVPSTYSSDYH